MNNKFNETLFIPNWNGHLYLQTKTDNSVKKLFEKFNGEKKIIEIEKNNFERTNEVIIEELKNKDNFFCVTGDHSNTYTLFKKFSKNKDKKNTKLVIFDAHPDVEISTDVVSHEDYLRNLIEDKIILPENIYIFGLRTMSRVEFDYLNNSKVNYFTIFDCLKNIKNIKKILKEIEGDIYLSFDFDCLDPDFAPATYYKEWCGFNLEEIYSLLEIISPKISSGDFNEFYIENDENKIGEENAIKIIKKIIK